MSGSRCATTSTGEVCASKREQPKIFQRRLPQSSCQNLALTGLHVPSSSSVSTTSPPGGVGVDRQERFEMRDHVLVASMPSLDWIVLSLA